MMTSAASSPVRLFNVQSLRAYGALAVAFFHTGFTLGIGLRRPIGSFGVGIFFVISGFIMAMICETDPRHFLARRIARIVPLYWVLTIAVFGIARLAPGLLGSTSADEVSLLKSLFFIPYVNHGTYFPILFLGWSLNYEMYFYLLIAAALLVYRRRAALVAAGVMVAILLALQMARPNGALMFYAHPIILLFVVGIFCYYGFCAIRAERILASRWLVVCAILAAGLAMIATAITTIGARNAIIVGFCSTVLVFSAVLLDKVGLSVRWPILILLGDASYVMYLIHPYCEETLNKIVARMFPILNSKMPVGMLVALGVTIVASIVVYRFVDNPLHVFFRNLLCKPTKLSRINIGQQPESERGELVTPATAQMSTTAD